MVDGNFKADHQAMVTPRDVYLSDGLGYWVGKERYQAHLKVAAGPVEVSSL